jgi:hypothetical protein
MLRETFSVPTNKLSRVHQSAGLLGSSNRNRSRRPVKLPRCGGSFAILSPIWDLRVHFPRGAFTTWNESVFAMERSLASAQERIVKLETQVEDLRTALNLIYEISQDRITPVWEVVEHIAVTAKHALNRNAE